MNKPLSNGFTFAAIIGLIISLFYWMNGTLDATWGFTLTFVFLIGAIAAYVSITPTDTD